MGKKNMSRKIEIPAGVFEGNCSDCIYADRNDIDSYGRIRCLAASMVGIIIQVIETDVFITNNL